MIDLDDEAAFLGGLKSIESQAPEEVEPEFKGLQVKVTPYTEAAPVPVPYIAPDLTKRLCTFDTETDPFLAGRVPVPFWAGFYDGEDFFEFWGDDCLDQLFAHVCTYTEPLVIYAHNGGKFDFHFLLDWLDEGEKPFLIGGRIVKVMLCGQEFRDSYSILPVALSKFSKLQIEYWKMERIFREQYKEEICRYARYDVTSLYSVVSDFIARFGWRLTIAGTALPYLEHFHGFNKMDKDQDAKSRPFYKGGRVQCMEVGVRIGKFIMIDRNSMYPAEMAGALHPVSSKLKMYKEIRDDTCFAYIEAENRGALGVGNGLDYDFTVKRGRFFATIHEIRAGIETKTLDVTRVIWTLSAYHFAKFDKFVEHFYSLRLQANAAGDMQGKEFYKLILNSAYGKLAMNTAGYKDWIVNPADKVPLPQRGPFVFEPYDAIDENTGLPVTKQRCMSSPDGWVLVSIIGDVVIWNKPKYNAGEQFLNTATAASITGAARASLWRAICTSTRPLYCDTDSIICEAADVELDQTKLGAWKIEAHGDAVFIAGKKMYAFLSLEQSKPDQEKVTLDGVDYYLIKKANKGVQLTGDQILRICRGETLLCDNAAPAFSFGGATKFVSRKIKMTAKGNIEQLELDL